MDYRTLGRTGVQVSPLCLGAMMFGAWGNTDHDECVRIIHRALDAGINFIDTADVYSAGESEEIVGKALSQGATATTIVLATKVHGIDGRRTPTPRATPGAGSSPSARTACGGWAPTTSTSTRSTGPTRRPTSTRRSGRSPTWSTPGKIRYFGARPSRPTRSSRPSGWPSAAAGSGSSPSSRPTRSWSAAIEADVLPVCAAVRHGRASRWSPLAGGWLSGRFGEGKDEHEPAGEPDPGPLRPVAPGEPAQARGRHRRSAEVADEAGLTLIELALGLRARAPGGDAADHRPADHGAARVPARRGRPRARPATSSTASTRSSRPAPTSTGAMDPGSHRRSPTRPGAGAPEAGVVRAVAHSLGSRDPR